MAPGNAPSVRYVRPADGTHRAYTVSGRGYPLVRMVAATAGITQRESPVYGPFAAALDERFSLVEYDGRGTGHSTRNISSWTIEDIEADLVAVTEAAKVIRFVLWAHGFGWPTAVRYAVRHPDRVAALVLWDPLQTDGWYGEMRLTTIASGLQREIAARMVQFGNGDRSAAISDGVLSYLPNDEDNAVMMRDVREHETAFTADLAVPTLLLQTQSPYPDEAERAYVTSLFPQARRVRLPGPEFAPVGVNLEPAMEALDQFLIDLVPEALPARGGNGHDDGLTSRERQVLALIAAGDSNAEIAMRLTLSESTVARHLANIYTKLGIHNRAQAAVFYSNLRRD